MPKHHFKHEPQLRQRYEAVAVAVAAAEPRVLLFLFYELPQLLANKLDRHTAAFIGSGVPQAVAEYFVRDNYAGCPDDVVDVVPVVGGPCVRILHYYGMLEADIGVQHDEVEDDERYAFHEAWTHGAISVERCHDTVAMKNCMGLMEIGCSRRLRIG